MRLRLFDRIRRLAHPRRPPAETASEVSGTQGRHRRGRRRGPATTPGSPGFPGGPGSPGGPDPARGHAPASASGEWSAPGGQPGELAHTASPWAGSSPTSEAPVAPGMPAAPGDPAGPWADHRVSGTRRDAGTRQDAGASSVRSGAARARIREAPADVAVGLGETARPVPAAPGPRARWHETAEPGLADTRAAELARVAAGVPRQPDGPGRSSWRAGGAATQAGLPFAPAHPRERPLTADGRRHCGSLEAILWRQWDPASPPAREVVAAVDRLAELPERIKERLADGLDAIFIGPGGVPELDDMTSLRGVPLPSGRASWDACAGAYGERKIVVGSRPSPTPDVMCHEVGHALDDLDSPPGKWQSDSAEFRMLYDQCQPHFASDFHRQPGGLGRKEFFADAFAAIASRQRPALVDMLSGDTRTALRVMLYFNRRYGI
jgi:hypothetical protein